MVVANNTHMAIIVGNYIVIQINGQGYWSTKCDLQTTRTTIHPTYVTIDVFNIVILWTDPQLSVDSSTTVNHDHL